MPVVRGLVIALLMLLAALFLAVGLGLPHLPWRGLPARDIPVGVLLIFAGLAVARFWTMPQDEGKLLEDWQRRRKPHR